ncbi:TPA: hypothetical protein ACOJPC_003120 [Vibrio fluvialis]|uniref:hypothetical protein n=1 Tax=Vibrio fluvialis TaxID=676 RepID=UPI001F1B547B|nr:hypothetical protein [Vibrio fluvialis]MCE7580924.1 hypothetical protein [Vibrio fluvialis]WDY54271.1 hypothetical protein PUN47_20695 [Vibrio fluvialis]
MGKGPKKVEETQYQKELAKTAAEEWNRYQDVYVPVENLYIEQAKKMGDESNYQTVAGDVNTSFNSAFDQQRSNADKQLKAAGVDPSSGKASATQTGLIDAQMGAESQATSAGQADATRRYVGNLTNVVAMGKGQETQSLAGLQDIAAASGRRANQAAINKANEVSYPAVAAGIAASGLSSSEGRAWANNAYTNLTNGNVAETGGYSLGAANGAQGFDQATA